MIVVLNMPESKNKIKIGHYNVQRKKIKAMFIKLV